jgi:hypothetical protein
MISKHITLKEATQSATATRLKIDNIPSAEVLANMKLVAEKCFEPLREWYGKPIIINSFYRSPALNKAVKGAKNSDHVKGMAIDLDAGSDNKKLFDYIRENLDFDQVIAEFPVNGILSWIHVSFKKDGNRKDVLVARKINNKTVYISYKNEKDLI